MNVFTYGTLMVPLIFRKITGRDFIARQAALHDYARFRIRDASYPGIVRRKGDTTGGVVYTGLDAESVFRLDAFEGEQYDRIEVTVILRSNHRMPAQTYVIRDAYQHLLTDQPWSLEMFQKKDQEAFIRSFSGFDRL